MARQTDVEMQNTRKTGEQYAIPLIERIVEESPERLAGSRSERRAQQILREEFEAVGLETDFHRFRFNRSIYANFALHFGLAVLGSLLYVQVPAAALGLFLLVGISYLGDSTRRFYLLRRLFPFYESQNLIGRLPADGAPDLRIAVLAHADAAYTGEIFEPDRLRASQNIPDVPFDLGTKPIRLATVSVFALAALSACTVFAGPSVGFSIGIGVATLPPLLVALANLEVVARSEIVPGANDNLTGCAGAAMLAERLADDKPAGVELVFVATGAEETGGGGAQALARDKLASDDWSPDETVVVGIDGLSNGELRYFREAEVVTTPIPKFLLDAIEDVRRRDEQFREIGVHEIPAGSTDVLAFRACGFPGVCLGCVDPEFGAPRHYHHPSDTPDHLDPDQIDRSVDFAEAYIRELIDRHLDGGLRENPG